MAPNQKLIVEVIDARNLLPKDGQGTSSPYVVIDFYGQRKRTHTSVRDLNPTWNETLEFNVGKPSNVFDDMLELDLYHDRTYGPTRRNNFLGRIRLSCTQFVRKGEEALIYYTLEKKQLFSWVQGEIGLKIYYQDEIVPVIQEPKKEEDQSSVQPAPAADQEKPPESEEPPASEKNAPPPPPTQIENAAPESESNTIPPPPPPPPPVEEKENVIQEDDDIVLEPPDHIRASAVSGSVPQVKLAPTMSINAPHPITRPLSPASTLDPQESISIERSSFDLVEKMHYVFARVVKARYLPTNGNPIVAIAVSGSRIQSKPARKTSFFEWDQTFAFGRDAPDSSTVLEISVWDHNSDVARGKFLGGICFDVTEIPLRDPPDSPLAPQWYRLEGGGANSGDLMLATWVGTQADDSFPEAWKTDTAGNSNSRAKVYVSPKLWYLRATVLEAQDVTMKESLFNLRAQLGFQVQKTKSVVTRNGTQSWNEDLLFVAAEPFADHLIFTLEARQHKGQAVVAVTRVPLTAIERRVDDRQVAARWFNFEDPNSEKVRYKGRVQLRLCFDGGYHVMDEAAHVCSDYRPTARQLWKSPIGTVELGIIGCRNLLPMKTIEGKGCTDSYCVAKYGPKWVRTRTVSDSLDPRWNEQYTWRVFDPSTVLTMGVFDSSGSIDQSDGEKNATRPDIRMGKVRIRISSLETGKVYRNSYPLIVLTNNGVKKMGEIDVAVRFIRSVPTLDFLHVYSQPLLPLMHHVKPLGVVQQEGLRNVAVKIIAEHLSRSEPPIKREVVLHMLDSDSHSFSMRKVRANWIRIINVIAGVIDIVRWIDDTRVWKNSTATILVHALMVLLVWFPDLIVPTLAFYVFAIGAWNYRFRSSKAAPPHFDPKLSLADVVDREELDEEFDEMPSGRAGEIVRVRYDKLRAVGARVQTVLGDLAAQGERVQALVTWRDPRATGIFVVLCFVVAMILYLVPSKMVAMACGFYYFRHPIFRDRMPSPVLNFFRRLPSLSDRIM
ncbi:Protein QUIRKY [Linum perenne]